MECEPSPSMLSEDSPFAAKLLRSEASSADQLSGQQEAVLAEAYAQDSQPGQATMCRLASELGLSLRAVANWFHGAQRSVKEERGDGFMTDDQTWRSQLLAAVEGLGDDEPL